MMRPVVAAWLGAVLLLGAVPASSADALRSGVTSLKQRSDADFTGVRLDRRRGQAKPWRMRIFTRGRGSHRAEGAAVYAFPRDSPVYARAREKANCDCAGLWIVDKSKRSGRRLLREMAAALREDGRAVVGTGFFYGPRHDDPGTAVATRVKAYNKRFRPFVGTSG